MKKFIKLIRFPLLLCLLIIIPFILLQPTSVSSLNLNNRQEVWNKFTYAVNGQRMDTKLFWQTREFYSPGHFIYKEEGMSSDMQDKLLKKVGLSSYEISEQLIVLSYHASSFKSFESLVPNANAAKVLQIIQSLTARKDVVAKGENFVIVKTAEDKAIVIFLATLDEMKRTNGFFKYEEDDKALVNDKSWLDVSEVTTK